MRVAELIRMRRMREEGVLPLEVKAEEEDHDVEQEEVKAVIPTY